MFKSISITRFRGFHRLTINPLERINLVIGRNNVGKTALLEAFYLLVGPTNPDLAIRINAFRGIERVRVNPEELWGWLFYEKKLDSTIELEAENEHRRTRSLRITLDQPKGLRFTNGKKRKDGLISAPTATTTDSRSDLILKYTSEQGERIKTRAVIKENGLGYEREKQMQFPTSIFMSSRAGYTSENPERLSKLEEVGGEKKLIPALKVLEPRLTRISVLVTGNGPMVHGDIGIGRLVPLPLMGDGIGKLLTLLLAIAESKDGVVLVDEIETGLHYSSMADVWTAVASFARSTNVQIIATTHSWECLKAAHQSFGSTDEYDFRVHRLDRIGGAVDVVTYDREMIDMALKSGMELR